MNSNILHTENIQFEKAVFENPNYKLHSCKLCRTPINQYYYIDEGETICPDCIKQSNDEISKTPAIVRFFKASILGLIAAALSSLAYYYIRDITGYEIAFAAIGVGVVIGSAVRRGSNKKGGWLYQSLAIFLTYISITSTYTPQLIDDFRARNPIYKSHTAFQILNDGSENNINPGKLLLNIGIITGFSMVVPLMTSQNFIFLLFITFGSFEAWRRNKPRRVVLSSDFIACKDCGFNFSDKILSCPKCNSIVHSEDLIKLAAQAFKAELELNYLTALELWRSAIEKLPSRSIQAEIITLKISALDEKIDSPPLPPLAGTINKKFKKGSIITVVFALATWVIKKIGIFVIPKLTLISSGLSEIKTIIGMFLSFGLFWPIWGWQLALGLIVSLYVHEIGHIFTLQKFGIKISGLSFIPGFGAFVRLKQYPNNPVENARVGLAGPMWGLWFSCIIFSLFLLTGWEGLKGAAKISAWINLMNLIPILPLDGGRGFQALSKRGRIFSALIIFSMFVLTNEILLLIVLAGAIFMLFQRPLLKNGDKTAFSEYAFLVIMLSLFSLIK